MLSEVPLGQRTEDCVGHRVERDIRIRVPVEAGRAGDRPTAQLEPAPILETMDIEALANPHRRHDRDPTIARMMPRSASVVIFGFG